MHGSDLSSYLPDLAPTILLILESSIGSFMWCDSLFPYLGALYPHSPLCVSMHSPFQGLHFDLFMCSLSLPQDNNFHHISHS